MNGFNRHTRVLNATQKEGNVGGIRAHLEQCTPRVEVSCTPENVTGGITIFITASDGKVGASIKNLEKFPGGEVWILVTAEGNKGMNMVVSRSEDFDIMGVKSVTLTVIAKLHLKKTGQDDQPWEMEISTFQVFVLHIDGKTYTYEVEAETKVEQLKTLIYKKHMFPQDQQRLLFGGRQLEDGNTLNDYGIKENATLHMVARLRGG